MNTSNPVNQDAFQKMLMQLRNSFLEDMPERFNRLEDLLLEMEKNGADRESFNEIYRIVHSLKGSGGTHGLHIITTVCHQFEDLLNDTDGGSKFSLKLISLSLDYVDLLRTTCEQIQASHERFPLVENRLVELRQKLAPKQFSVLLADDSKLSTNICLQTLADLPVHITVVHDGLQALTRALTEPFDLVITANEIPRLNGIALVGALKLSDTQSQHIKSILLTSNKNILSHQNRAIQADYTIIKDGNMMLNLADAVKLALAISE
ncbi:MAG: Hpt domain-containing protein [Gallionellaceae bacterium]